MSASDFSHPVDARHGGQSIAASVATFVDGIGPPLEQIEEDYRDLVQRPYDPNGNGRIGVQAAADVLSLIAEVRRLRERDAELTSFRRDAQLWADETYDELMARRIRERLDA